jgi:hypothetical protein
VWCAADAVVYGSVIKGNTSEVTLRCLKSDGGAELKSASAGVYSFRVNVAEWIRMTHRMCLVDDPSRSLLNLPFTGGRGVVLLLLRTVMRMDGALKVETVRNSTRSVQIAWLRVLSRTVMLRTPREGTQTVQ